MQEDQKRNSEVTLGGDVAVDEPQEVTLEEKERRISSTIEGLPEAAAILTYED